MTNPATEALLQLKQSGRFASSFVGVREAPARPAEPGPWPAALHPDVVAAARRLGIERLYAHQSEAVAESLKGRPVAVATGTASGKSLCYLLPVVDAILRHPDATALMLFPTKALAHDQLAVLRAWDAALDGALRPAAYDGDTPSRARRGVRDRARVVVTNPDMLHTGILPNHTKWERILSGLRFVVIDEMHVYRGVFGSHVANTFRRLRRLVEHYEGSPVPILCSATIANPSQVGRELTGRDVHVVDRDASPTGRRTLVFFNPPVVDEVLNLRRSTLLEADRIARLFLDLATQTIVFARSRQSTELIAKYISDGLRQSGGVVPPSAVRGYRGGYTATERREIEAGLRSGAVRCVVATNALELGVDIGQLDACIMAGYPGTIASTWQQAGRAGRRTGHSVAVLIAGNHPVDQFVIRHPEYFFDRSPEHARLDPDNLLILLDHLRCACFELPFDDEEASRPFGAGAGGALEPPLAAAGTDAAPVPAGPATNPGDLGLGNSRPKAPAVRDLLAVLEANGELRRVADRWYWMADAYPAESVSLRAAGPADVTIVVRGPGGEDVLGTVGRGTAPITVYPGAVYMHDGIPYEVEQLDWEAGRALVSPTDESVYTRASTTTAFRPLRVDRDRTAPGSRVYTGELEIRSRATAYRRIRFRTHETVGWGAIDLPEQVHVAGGYWITLDADALAALESRGTLHVDRSGDRGPDWAEVREVVRARDGYRCVRCGAPERPGRGHDVHHLAAYGTFRQPDGSTAHQAANRLENLVTLCRPCHSAVERSSGAASALGAAATALTHIASLYLMCDPRDLGVTTDAAPSWTDGPTVAVFERAAAGVGFGATLYDLHADLVAGAADLIASCPCADGCPSCVGPGELDLAGPPGSRNLKAGALAVFRVLTEAG